ncbi:MAG: 1-(5-phosphoribosyl)-5-[(5-phosphoribosylamino)methylideneamino]imidazole-4-carboxamide isomerase [Pseudomonadota bacterium]
MLVIPAIDLKGGRCVRLRQGIKEQETVYSDNPVETAKRWEAAGAEVIHVVDLDGAFDGEPQNFPMVKKVAKAVNIPVQLGGGIRDLKTIKKVLAAGVSRVVLGTAALREVSLLPEACRLFAGRIAASIDARDGFVAVEGWTKDSGRQALDVARQFEDAGACALIYTDIARDGMQTGPNIDALKRLAKAVETPVIAAGGINNMEDIKSLLKLEALGIEGVITGRAIYAGSLDLREAIILSRHRLPKWTRTGH